MVKNTDRQNDARLRPREETWNLLLNTTIRHHCAGKHGFFVEDNNVREIILPPLHEIMGAEMDDLISVTVRSTAPTRSTGAPWTGRKLSIEDLIAGMIDAEGRYVTGEMHQQRRTTKNLAGLLYAQGKLGEAEPLYSRALESQEQQLGAAHPDTLNSMNNLAALLYAQGKLGEAEPLYRRALEGREQQLGAAHPSTLTSVNNLAGLLQAQGKLGEAEPLYRRALEGSEQQLGVAHPYTLTFARNLARLMESSGRAKEARQLCARFGVD
jgi:tetratricopeptide (TPR) repeat protein